MRKHETIPEYEARAKAEAEHAEHLVALTKRVEAVNRSIEQSIAYSKANYQTQVQPD